MKILDPIFLIVVRKALTFPGMDASPPGGSGRGAHRKEDPLRGGILPDKLRACGHRRIKGDVPNFLITAKQRTNIYLQGKRVRHRTSRVVIITRGVGWGGAGCAFKIALLATLVWSVNASHETILSSPFTFVLSGFA